MTDFAKLVAPYARRLSNMIARGTVTLVDAATKMQSLQLRLLAGESKDKVEHFEPYGFTSQPNPGAECLALFLDGDRSHGVVVCVADRRYRVKGLTTGEVILHDDQGQSVYLTVGVAFVCDGNGTGAAILPTAAQIAAIANFIDGLRPVTAHVTVYAPVAVPVNFTVEGLSPDTLAEQRAVTAELADLLAREGQPGGTILLSHMRSAISAAAGEWDYVLITPAANIVMSAGQIPVMGSVTWL